MQNLAAVLCIGHDEWLLQLRCLVLGTRFATVRHGQPSALGRLLAQQPFDLLVLCHTLSQLECQDAIDRFRLFSPAGAVLAVYTHNTDFSLAEVDASIPALAGPERLFFAVDGIHLNGLSRFTWPLPH